MEEINSILEQPFQEISDFDSDAFRRKRVQWENDAEGTLTGYDCRKCKNKGVIYYLDENGCKFARECECMEIRRTLSRIERSGLSHFLERLTFDSYQVHNNWQATVKNSAMEFVDNPSGCFFIGGNTGSGKTHICTAICGELIKQGYEVRYYLWRDLLHRLEANRFEEDRYSNLMDEIRNTDVVYIDDFLKTKCDKSKNASALEYAFEIINQRYISRKITILSSEWYLDEIFTLDGAAGGRIHEMCKNPMFEMKIVRGNEMNYRLMGS